MSLRRPELVCDPDVLLTHRQPFLLSFAKRELAKSLVRTDPLLRRLNIHPPHVNDQLNKV